MASSSSNTMVSNLPNANKTLPNLRVVSVLVTIPEFRRISKNDHNVPDNSVRVEEHNSDIGNTASGQIELDANSHRVVYVNVEHSVNVHMALEQPSNSTIYPNGPLVNEQNQSPIASPNYSNVDSSVQATPCKPTQIKEEPDDINTSNVINRNIETNPSQLVQNVIGNGDHLIGQENIVSSDNYNQGDDSLTQPPTTQQSSNLPVNIDSPVQATPYSQNQIKEESDDINTNNVDNENTQTDQMQLEQNSIENVYNLIGQTNIVSTDGYNHDAVIVPLVPPQSSNAPSNVDASLQATPYQENPIKEEPDDLNTNNVHNSYTGSDQMQLEQNSTEYGDHLIGRASIVSTDDNIQVDYRPSPISMPFPPPQSSNAPPLHAPHPTDGNQCFYCHTECDCASCHNIKQYFIYNNINLGTGVVYINQSLEEVMNGAGNQQQQHQPQVFQGVANDGTNEVTFPSEPSNSATRDRQLQPQDSNVVVTGVDSEVPLQQPSLDVSINEQQNTNSSEQTLSPSHEDSDEDEMSSESQLPAQALQDDAQMQVDSQALSQHNEVTTRSATNSQTASRNEMIDVIAGPSGQKSSNATSPTNNSSQIFTTENELFYCPHEACLVSENSEEKVLGHIVAVHLPQLGLGVRNGKRVVNQVDIMSQFGTLQNGVAKRSTTKRQTGENHENAIEAIADPSNLTSSKANSPTATDENVTNLRRSCRMAEPKNSYVMLEEDDENDMGNEFDPSDTEENDDDDDDDDYYEEEEEQVVPINQVKRVRSELSPSVTSENEDDSEEGDVRAAKIRRLSKKQRANNKSESGRSKQSTIKTRPSRISKPVESDSAQSGTEDHEDDEDEQQKEVKFRKNKRALKSSESTSSSTKQKQMKTIALQCSVCYANKKPPAMFAKEQFDKHLEEEHSILKYRCEVKNCKESFHNRTKYYQHYKSHQDITKWQCDKCVKHFPTYKLLYVHIFKIHQIGDFECSLCSFKSTGVNRNKMYSHYERKHQPKINCTYPGCSFQAQAQRDVNIHQRIHYGIKPYRCKWSQCDNASISVSTIYKHICDKHFKPNPNLVPDGAKPKDYVKVLKKLLLWRAPDR